MNWFKDVLWLAAVQAVLFAVYCAALIWSILSQLHRWWQAGFVRLK